jgi:hypothetical protein
MTDQGTILVAFAVLFLIGTWIVPVYSNPTRNALRTARRAPRAR